MPEKALASILDRHEPQKLIAQHFAPQLVLLDQLANFGSNLVMRAYNSSSRNLQDVIVCGVLLKHFVSMLDATEVLVRTGAIHAAHLAGRAAFEASLYAQWMLMSDTKKKAAHYYVANLRQERLWARRVIAGTSESEEFEASMADLAYDIHSSRPALAEEAVEHLSEVNRILAQREFAAVDREFDEQKRRRKYDPTWHEVLGNKSVRSIASTLRRLPEYDLFYAKGSQVTHAASSKDHVRFTPGKVHLKGIRNLEGLDTLLNCNSYDLI